MRNLLRKIFRALTAPFRLIFKIFRGIWGWIRNVFTEFKEFFTGEPEDTPVPDAFAKAIQRPQDILVHLDALRKHLFRAVVVMAIATGISFVFTRDLMELLAQPLDGGFDALQAIDVTEPLGVFMRVALLAGFSFSLPYSALELWLFAGPGLSRRARVLGLFAIPAVVLFFIAGMLFAYFVMLPTALPFLTEFMDIRTEPRPSTYFPFVTGIMFWVGIAFQFPLVIFVLSALGIVNAQMLIRRIRLAVVIMAIVAAAITPTVDPVNMFLVWAPLVGLYFLGIGLAFIGQRPRRKTQTPNQETG
jgi:sec-independent protein translocase protein TatC